MQLTKISTLIVHASVVAATALRPDDMAPRGHTHNRIAPRGGWESGRDFRLAKAAASASSFEAKHGNGGGFKAVRAAEPAPAATAIPDWQAQRDAGKAKGLKAAAKWKAKGLKVAAKWKAKYGGGNCKKCNNNRNNKNYKRDDHDHDDDDDNHNDMNPETIADTSGNNNPNAAPQPDSQTYNSWNWNRYNGGGERA